MLDITAALRDHRLAHLFHECLGWDRAPNSIVVEVDGRAWALETIAQKCGLQVLWRRTDRLVLMNRALLRSIQQKVIKLPHEHILILSCEEPRKQVWLWAVRQADGRRVRHREHPFFSGNPPDALLNRLTGLRFDFAEEATANLVDASRRVRVALDATPDLNLFAKHPGRAARSDALARRMKAGDIAAYHAFIMFHWKLARKLSKCLRRWFGMLPEDAEQIAVLGLIRAAQKFDPERGYQFSTYAQWWIKNKCQVEGPYFAMTIRVPINTFRSCFYHWIRITRLGLEQGPDAIRDLQAELECADGKWARQWRGFVAARNIRSLSEPEFRVKARRLPESFPHRLDRFTRPEDVDAVRLALTKLHPRLAAVMRARFGIDRDPETLLQIGERLGITRERVRQLESSALNKLHLWLDAHSPEWCDAVELPDDESNDPNDPFIR